jgi:geranylgeranyl pyrophosphate synthase
MQQNNSQIKKKFKDHWNKFCQNLDPQDGFEKAVLYALNSPGKKNRPLYVMLGCESYGSLNNETLDLALAVELVHCYSLVHDDLPIMDNDDYRRGRESVHKHFDPATALLVGNELLSKALQLVSSHPKYLSLLQQAHQDMLRGQYLDMKHSCAPRISQEKLKQIHNLKTGSLIKASLVLGGLSAKAPKTHLDKLSRFGEKLGLIYQILDDLNDNSKDSGKSQGKDLDQQKQTFLHNLGQKKSFDLLNQYTEQAFAVLSSLPKNPARESLSALLKSHS